MKITDATVHFSQIYFVENTSDAYGRDCIQLLEPLRIHCNGNVFVNAQEIEQDGPLQTAISTGAGNYARDDTPMAENTPQPSTKKYPLTAPTEDGSYKEFTAVDKNILGSTPPEEMVISKTQQVPVARLQDTIDNVEAKTASPKNGQRKSPDGIFPQARPTLKGQSFIFCMTDY
ncbi:hypothetical protein JTB14_038131 [Gonioctena quinquepunctata]|nr:hypothetical protein JTB14_038131 [Gonioctena quinquepunctata]